MANRSIADRLDDAVEAILRRHDAPLAPADPDLDRLQQIAADLRGMPNEDFRTRLEAELRRPIRPSVQPVREGFHTVTLYLTVARAGELLEFVKRAFGATETLRAKGSAGGLHAEVRIGNSMVMMGGAAGMPIEMPATIHLYVEDADAAYLRALEAGATKIYEPMDQPYGDREAGVKDAFGNTWYIATHRGASAIPPGLRSVTPYLHQRGTPRMIEFLQQAFGAEEAERDLTPEGVVAHAKIRIGDSVVEMGEAHGPYQPVPAALYLSVPDVDAQYERAVGAGATSLLEPADQPYGDRMAGVKDPFGNTWYIATHIKDVAR